MQKIIIKTLIKIVLKKLEAKNLVRILGLLECGFFDFCYKQHIKAIKEGREDLAQKLLSQALEEDAHSRMLWALIDGKNRPHRSEVHKKHCGLDIENPAYFTGKNSWIAVDGSGRLLEWQNTNGISRRYVIAKAFFANKKAENYDWGNTLAFMCVGEQLGRDFYTSLAQCLDDEKTRAILQKIATDEQAHTNYLHEALKAEVGIIKAYWLILKWNFRKFKAIFFIPHDLHQITQRKKTSA